MTGRKIARILRRVTRGLADHPGRFIGMSLGMARAWISFRGATLGAGVIATGRVDVDTKGATVHIGSGTTFGGGMIRTRIKARPGATVLIGDHSVLNYGVTIDCAERIEIGTHCIFGSMVNLCDHTSGRSAAIIIEDDVWVAHGVSVAPGVRVGQGSVLAAGSVITQDVPPRSMAIGRPARVVSLQMSGQSRREPMGVAVGAPS